jgi:transglutaminase-like putative cysteine protease
MSEKERMPLILIGLMMVGLLIHIRTVTGIEAETWFLVPVTIAAVGLLALSEQSLAFRITASIGSLGVLLMMLTSPVSLMPMIAGHNNLRVAQSMEHLLMGDQSFSNFINGLYYYALDFSRYPFQSGTLFYFLLIWAFTLAVWYVFVKANHRHFLLMLPMFLMIFAWFQGYWITTGFLIYFCGYAGLLFASSDDRGFSGFALAGLALLIGAGLYGMFPVEKTIQRLDEHFGQSSWFRTEYSPFSGGNFTFDDTIYEPLDNRLGGPVTLRRDRVFSVRSDHGGHVYLRGRVLTIYDGKSWSRESSDLEIFYLDVPPRLRGLQEPRYDLEIFDLNLDSKTVFAPMGVRAIDLPVELLRRDRYGIVFLDRSISALENGYRIASMVPQPIRLDSGSEYFQLPQDYSPRVREFTAELIADSGTTPEKIEAIREYLTSLTYSLSPAVPDPEADFVEQFIFGEEKGYCTYFASAMVVMARSAGIPARYVEGFLTPLQANNDGDYIVTADRAHAWAEVYMNERWQVIEATPAYLAEILADSQDSPVLVPGETDPVLPGQRPEETEDDIETGGENGDPAADGVYTGLKVAGILVLLAISGLLTGRWRAVKHQAQNPQIRFADDVMTLLVLKHGVSEWAAMTPREVIWHCAGAEAEYDPHLLTRWVEAAYYTAVETPESAESLRSLRDELVRGEKNILKKLQFWYWVYLKGERSTWS